jgi:hypothetical protein
MLSFFMIGSSVAVCLQYYLDQAKRRIASSLWEPREGIALNGSGLRQASEVRFDRLMSVGS